MDDYSAVSLTNRALQLAIIAPIYVLHNYPNAGGIYIPVGEPCTAYAPSRGIFQVRWLPLALLEPGADSTLLVGQQRNLFNTSEVEESND